MTVAELINELKKLPQDAEVVAYQAWGNTYGPETATIVELCSVSGENGDTQFVHIY